MSLFSKHKTIEGEYTHQSAEYLFVYIWHYAGYGKVALKIHMIVYCQSHEKNAIAGYNQCTEVRQCYDDLSIKY